MEQDSYSISELARDLEVTARTIRFYEEQGLIDPERRGQQRVFNRRDRARLKLILRGKRIGLSLAEIREILDLYQRARDEAQQSQLLLQLLRERRAQLERQRQDIDEVLHEIDVLAAHCQEVVNSQSGH